MIETKKFIEKFLSYLCKSQETALSFEEKNLQTKLAQVIINSSDPQEIKNKISQEIAISLNANRCFFLEYDPSTNNFKKITNAYNSKREEISILSFDTEVELHRFALELKYKKSLVIQDTDEYIKKNKLQGSKEEAYIKKYNIKALIAIRLEFGENFLGVFVVHYDKKYLYKKSHLTFLKDIGEHISIALFLSSLYINEKNKKEKEQLLSSIISIIAKYDELDLIFEKVFEILTSVFDTQNIFVKSNIEEFKDLNFSNRNLKSIDKNSYKDLCIYNSAILKKIKYKTNYIPDTKNFIIKNNLENSHIEAYFVKNEVKSLVLVPISYKKIELGEVIIHFNISKPITNDDLTLIKTIVTQLAIAIKQYQSYKTQIKIAEREKFLRELITETRKLQDHYKIYSYLIDNIHRLFHSDRALHIHYKVNGEIIIEYQVYKDFLQPIEVNTIPESLCLKELILNNAENLIVINDVESEITDKILKGFLIDNQIKSFFLYSTDSNIYPPEGEELITSTMITMSSPKVFKDSEIESLRLIIETTNAIYCEIKQNQEAERIKQSFLATLTHDLRSPLDAEQKALEAILYNKLGDNLADFYEYLQDIYNTNNELLRIVNNILSVFHYESGEAFLNIQTAFINNIVNESVKSLTPLAKEQGSDIFMEMAPDLPPVEIDKGEIYRVINNLLSNAIKHNKKDSTIKIKTEKIDENIRVSISDNGKGIPESEKPKIFHRFPTEKRKIGTGLGLYLSKQIINLHHGEMWFETEEGKGTIFYFTLPYKRENRSYTN